MLANTIDVTIDIFISYDGSLHVILLNLFVRQDEYDA